MTRKIAVITGALGGILLLAVFLARSSRPGPTHPEGRRAAHHEQSSAVDSPLMSVEPSQPQKSSHVAPRKTWPPEEMPLGPPGGSLPRQGPDFSEPDQEPADSKVTSEPELAAISLPSREMIRELSQWKPEGPEAKERLQELLLRAGGDPTSRAIALEKVRVLPPEDAVPLLKEFIESPDAPGKAYTKPTAVALLLRMKHPLADAALMHIAQTTRDERVMLALAGLSKLKTEGK